MPMTLTDTEKVKLLVNAASQLRLNETTQFNVVFGDFDLMVMVQALDLGRFEISDPVGLQGEYSRRELAILQRLAALRNAVLRCPRGERPYLAVTADSLDYLLRRLEDYLLAYGAVDAACRLMECPLKSAT